MVRLRPHRRRADEAARGPHRLQLRARLPRRRSARVRPLRPPAPRAAPPAEGAAHLTALPPALARWAPMLGLFPDEVAGELGRWIPRIALAIGPMRTSRPDGSGDPDGFAGLARRGSYERLLLTEWLLADEAPDEFARRAAMGEHAFFHLARRSPARAASSVAIFDTGPDQIGAPRIAGLAALIVLAERASRAGARFAWGILHDPGGA